MSRSLWFVLGFAVLAAAPARAEDFWFQLGEAIGQAIVDEATSDGNNGNWNNNGNNWNNGHNNHHHNHNNGYYDNGYNNYNYQPVRPNPQYQRIWNGSSWEYVSPSPSVVYPSTTVVSPAVTAAPVVQNALPYKGPGVTIALEEDEGGAVTYTVDGKESATIQAGQQQTLTAKGKYEIRFSRGKSPEGRDFGQARYTITEGNYHFKVTDKGWELLRDKDQPTIVTTPIQPASPSGIKTNSLPSKSGIPSAAAPSAAGNAVPNFVPTGKSAAAVPPPPAAPAAPAAGG